MPDLDFNPITGNFDLVSQGSDFDGRFLKLDQTTPQTTVGTFTFPTLKLGGTLATGLLKHTTTTGVLSIAVASDVPDLSSLYLPLAGGTMTGTINSLSLIPTVDSTYDLGSPTKAFKNEYLRGNLIFNPPDSPDLAAPGVIKFNYLYEGTLYPLTIASATGDGYAKIYLKNFSNSEEIAFYLDWDGSGGATWIDMPTLGSSGLGSGGSGNNAWIAYAGGDASWFADALTGDIVYRNTGHNLLFGIERTAGSQIKLSSAGITINDNIVPGMDSLYNLGDSTHYFNYIYGDRLYLNSTAYLAGGTSGTVTTNGTAFANAIDTGGGQGVPFAFGVQGTALKTIFLSVASESGHNAWAQSQWNANVTEASSYYDNNYPGVQMLLGLGSNYGANGSVSWYYHPASDFTKVYNIASISHAGMVIDHQLGAYYPRVATARLDIFTEDATKLGLNLRPYTAQTADLLRCYEAHADIGTTYGTKISALGSVGVGLSTKTPTARLETLVDGTDYATPQKTTNSINWGNATWAGFFQRTAGLNHPGYGIEVFPFVIVERARGTVTSPTAVQSGDVLGEYLFAGYSNAWNRQSAKIQCKASENFVTTTNWGTNMYFYTTPTGSATIAARMTILNSGNVGIGTITPSEILHIVGNLFLGTDSNKIYLGAGKDMSFLYDGTYGKIDTSLVAPSDLQLTCGANKTLELQNVVYEDMRVVPGSFDRPGVSDPTIVAYDVNAGGVSTYLWEFKKNDVASFTVQVPHSYKQGQDIKCHIHWTPGARGTAENGNTVGWKVEYSWANINGAFGTMASVDLSDACDGTNHKHQMTPDITITGSGKNVSSMLICNVKRTDTGTDDTWASTTSGQLPMLLEIDFHFPVDTMGSRDWGTK